MATITEDKRVFMETALDTYLDSICVKKRGMELKDMRGQDHGILVSPHVSQGPIAMLALKETMSKYHPVVIVRGWGWGVPPDDSFVWTGTSDEFNKTWEID